MTDELDTRLARLNSEAHVSPQVLDELARSTRDVAASTVRRRLVGGVTAALLVFGAGAVAAPAAADAVRDFLAQTGRPIGSGTEIIPDSEWIDLGAPDLREYVESIYPEYVVLAPGQTREGAIDVVVNMWAQRNGETQAVGLQRTVETLAFCGWTNEWISAREDDDPGRAQTAAEMMLLTTTWPAVIATDGGGIVEDQLSYANAALAGNRAGVSPGLTANGCSFYENTAPEGAGE